MAWYQVQEAGTSHLIHTQQAGREDRKQGEAVSPPSLSPSVTDFSKAPPPLSFPNSTSNQGPTVQTHENIGSISLSGHHTYTRPLGSVPSATKKTIQKERKERKVMLEFNPCYEVLRW